MNPGMGWVHHIFFFKGVVYTEMLLICEGGVMHMVLDNVFSLYGSPFFLFTAVTEPDGEMA